ncbi:hypothetical protein HG531_005769 [Fusarium graminearum]|nr:hypothetical protein HG531_005769 [Fusarium graminearum]
MARTDLAGDAVHDRHTSRHGLFDGSIDFGDGLYGLEITTNGSRFLVDRKERVASIGIPLGCNGRLRRLLASHSFEAGAVENLDVERDGNCLRIMELLECDNALGNSSTGGHVHLRRVANSATAESCRCFNHPMVGQVLLTLKLASTIVEAYQIRWYFLLCLKSCLEFGNGVGLRRLQRHVATIERLDHESDFVLLLNVSRLYVEAGDLELDAIGDFLASDLTFNGVTFSCWHGHELADLSLLDCDAIEPVLTGNDDVVLHALALTDEVAAAECRCSVRNAGFARDGVDASDGNLDGIATRRLKAEPDCLLF